MKIFFLLLIALLPISGFGQNVQLIRESATPLAPTKVDSFHYVTKNFQVPMDDYVATLQGNVSNSGKSVLTNLFHLFWKHANHMGADAFTVDSVRQSNRETVVTISLYRLKNEELEEDRNLYPRNKVYIIGGLERHKSEKKIRLNNEKINLQSLHYIICKNKPSQEFILNVGGVFGSRIKYWGHSNEPAKYIAVGGIGLSPNIDKTTFGIGIHTGEIHELDSSLGLFLVNCLTQVAELR